MARSAETKPRRERTPPPPRMTGVGLTQMTLFGGLIAIVGGILGVVLATSGSDPNVERRVDSAGAAICAVLTALEPDWWDFEHSTYKQAKARLKRVYHELNLGTITKEGKAQVNNWDVIRSQANKKRLANLHAKVVNLDAGIVRGLQLDFAPASVKDSGTGRARSITQHRAGARITNPSTINYYKTIGIGDDIQVGTVTATTATGSGTFPARVYHREYRSSGGGVKGDAYVIMSQSAIAAKSGGGAGLVITPLLIAVGVALIFFAANNASAGMKNLARDLDMVGRGKLDHRFAMSGSGEIGFLQRMADRMAKNLQMIQSTGSTDLDEAVEKEMTLASEIHESLRPSDPPRVPGYELETLFKAGGEIGGDYFDYIDLDENRIALIIADCSESLRGVPAAMVMAMTRAYLKAAVDPDSGPVDWLKWVNRRLSRDLKSGMAVTALVAVLDTSKGEVTAASAGHRPIVMWRKGKTALINPNGIALGLDVGPVFEKTIEEKRFAMAKNDRIVLYTDGLITAENEAGDQYGEERFMDSVRRQGAMNSAAFVNFVASGVDKFMEGFEQQDDITISTLKKMK